ncbi:MAG: leucine-rich repeat domain-containing protein, partial [Clostridia bacterium]|nr:leucine-rich repeat domain-containing protein [Clostridia bacterium]
DFDATQVSNPLYYAHNLYLNNTLVTVLRIPSTVTEINSRVFYGFGGTEVVFPNSVKTIGNNAFYSCSNLQKVTFATDTADLVIGASAFYDCASLSSVIIPTGVKEIQSYAFRYCPRLIAYCKATTRPSAWSTYWCESSQIVYDCDNNNVADNGTIYLEIDGVRYSVKEGVAQVMLQHVYLAGNVTILGVVSDGNTNYTVTSVVMLAFENCKGLQSVTVNTNSLTIENYAFSGCSQLTTFTFAEQGESTSATIKSYAFQNCTALTNLVIPETVTSIGDYAFLNCSSLSTVQVLTQELSEDEEPNPSLGLKSIGAYAFEHCSLLTSFNIPQSVIYIGERAFEYCTSLISLNVPQSVAYIGYAAFNYCNALTLYVEAEQDSDTVKGWYRSWDQNGLLNVTGTGIALRIVWDCNNNNVDFEGYEYVYINGLRYAIKDGTATVAEQPKNITTATIPAKITYNDTVYSVVGIRQYAFNSCKELTTVIFQTDENFVRIDRYAFYKCEKLTSITIPESVTVKGYGIFDGCTSLNNNG